MSNASLALTSGPIDKMSNRYQVGEHCLVVTGRFPKVAQLRQELYYEIDAPERFSEEVKAAKVPADIFTFLHKFPQKDSVHPYRMEWDNFAAIPITTYDDWLKSLPKQTRRGLRKATEAGVEVRFTDLNDDFVRGVGEIFNENPLRQGKRFWHYGKNFQQVKEVLSMDMEKARFLAAYCQGELIGFIKLLHGRNFARTTLILSKVAERSKYPNNAMISAAVKACIEQHIPYLVYGQLDYGKVGNKTLAEFKANNGFQIQTLARYFIPLTLKGRLSLALHLHHGLLALVPKPIVQLALQIRNSINSHRING